MVKHPLLVALSTALIVASTLPQTAPVSAATTCVMSHGDAEPSSCNLAALGAVEVSDEAGLGQLEIHGDLGAVVQREDGQVALVDVSDPTDLRVLGRYDGHVAGLDTADPLDGDVAFSHDGRYLFYARQTRDYSYEGLHVLDVADPAEPQLVDYAPQGGTLRVAYASIDGVEYLVTLDAMTGVMLFRFERTPAGPRLVPEHIDALPALKVGGPASAGVYIDAEDAALGIPLLYVATGRTGLQVFDFSTPSSPQLLGTWSDQGLADIAVAATDQGRTVYAATEYWFSANTRPEILELDLTDISAPALQSRSSASQTPYPGGVSWRLQGMAVAGDLLYVAHSHAGLGVLSACCESPQVVAATTELGEANLGGDFATVSPYAMDVEVAGGVVFVSDASTGTLSAFAEQLGGG